jgi:hypothetical protein
MDDIRYLAKKAQSTRLWRKISDSIQAYEA